MLESGETLKGKVALVTGGSRGIGRAIALHLSQLGADVWLSYAAAEDKASKTIKECNREPNQALKFDVASESGVEEGIQTILKARERLDIVVCNAGISNDSLLVRSKLEAWQRTLDVNLTGAYLCARAAVKSMMRARSGRIIFLGSVVGEMGNPGQAAYCASKAGLSGLTKSIAKEVGSRGITVNCVAPGFIETDMTESLPENVRSGHLEGIPLGRYGNSQEVADLIGFLCSESAGYITGQVIGINGGLYM
jgi:3-oxoacyl-[acyl-carrier protein] reductase